MELAQHEQLTPVMPTPHVTSLFWGSGDKWAESKRAVVSFGPGQALAQAGPGWHFSARAHLYCTMLVAAYFHSGMAQPHLFFIPLPLDSLHLSIFGHIARTDDDADAKMILTAPPPDNWKRPPGRPHITWLNTIQRDLRAYNLTQNKAVNLAQNRPLWRLMSTHGATHS